jgi:hypothetical protein
MNEGNVRKLVREFLQEDLGSWVKEKSHKAWQGTKDFGKAVSRESRETLIAAKILGKLLTKKEPTPEEIKFLKGQTVDLGKAVALLGLQFVPGSSLGIIALEKMLKKHGMTMFPKSQGNLAD